MLRAVGIYLVLAGVAAGCAFVFTEADAVRNAATLASMILAALAIAIFLLPPVVIRSGSSQLRVGGRLTVRPVRVAWTDIEGVSSDGERLYLDRGADTTLVFPLAYVGRRREALVREVYDRLNQANGYSRFIPG